MIKVKLSAILLAAFVVSAHAGGTVWAVDDDQGVAMEAANVLAAKAAMQRGTCIDLYSAPHHCNKDANGGKSYACPAGYAHHKGSCKGAPTALQDFNEAVEALKNLDKCYQREEECAKAAGIAASAMAK